MHATQFLLSFLAAAPGALAWGTVGHATVAAIANNYLTTQGKAYVVKKLGQGVSMESIASWADNFRYTSAGRFSAPYHFIDAEDSPPSSCSVDLSRDCGAGGCVVAAIANYTERVQDTSLSADQQSQAFKNLVHFLGDITQPLHDEAEKVGGNDIAVTWDGKTTNLHACWDTQMVEKLAGGPNSTQVVADFAQSLIDAIDTGEYASQKDGWVACADITRASDCALTWAQDANKINCQYVLATDETNKELDGAYYDGAKPYILEQLAKGGYRLGKWVNALAAAAV